MTETAVRLTAAVCFAVLSLAAYRKNQKDVGFFFAAVAGLLVLFS